MTREMELKKIHLEMRKIERPLEERWLRMDNMQIYAAVLVYYGINPSSSSRPGDTNGLIVEQVDYLGIAEVFINSNFSDTCPNGYVSFPRFIEWLETKKFPIPAHLCFESATIPMRKCFAKENIDSSLELGDKPKDISFDEAEKVPTVSTSEMSRKDIVTADLTKLTEPQLKQLGVRTIAAYLWKKEEYKTTSAAELVTKKEFADAITHYDAETFKVKTLTELISSLSPRARKKK